MAQRRPRGRGSKKIERNRDYMIEDLSQEEIERMNSRRKRKKGGFVLPLLIFLGIIGLSAAIAGGFIAQKYAPTTERKELTEWYEASGSEVRIYVNDAIDRKTNGLFANGAVYLPVEWIQENLNKRFYWQAEDEQLIYTLPDEVVRYTAESKAADGASVYRVDSEGEMRVNLAVVQQYTDIRVESFADKETAAKRVYIYTNWEPAQAVTALSEVHLRTKGGVKSPILTDAPEGAELKLLETMEKWSKVLSPDGVIGFVQNKYLSEPFEKTWTSDFEAPVYAHQTLPEKVVLGWHMVFGKSAAVSTLDGFYENTKGIMNVISPTGIQISDAEGNYENFINEKYVERAHELGLQVWVVVDNFNQPGGLRDFSTKDYFARAENRQSFIDRLMADAEACGYDGFNLDFEGIPSDAGPSYVQFYRELSVACRARGLVLSIDNYVPYHFNDHYDLGEQADYADYIIIMGYDEHASGSEEAGSVSSIGYTKLGIEETLKKADAAYVVNGIPFFTRIWKQSGPNLSSDAMGMIDAAAYVEEQGIKLHWDEETGQYYGKKETSTGSRQIWMEEERSVAEKVKVIEENNLGGVAAWRLGYEPSDIWDELDLNGVLEKRKAEEEAAAAAEEASKAAEEAAAAAAD